LLAVFLEQATGDGRDDKIPPAELYGNTGDHALTESVITLLVLSAKAAKLNSGNT
jgi:hypothetical protein